MATAVPPMGEEHRRRIRAFTLSALGGVALLVVGVLTFALVVGFPVPGTGTVAAVARTDQERDVVVRAVIGDPGCEELTGIDVTESATQVDLTVRTSIPNGTRWDLTCHDVATFVYSTVRLDAPLGDRTVLDDTAQTQVQVLDSVTDLTHDG